jgi:16S rRNA (cytidine1402-2'-O)-methyltransferase
LDHFLAEPCIYIVATPIGNLEDLTPRALETLRTADIIAAEDTRNTRKLLTHFNIVGKELVSYHDHVEEFKSQQLVERIQRDGLSLALVSDAGTPCVADPGYRLVRLAKKYNIKVHPIPGASAVTSLVSASGLPSDRFLFVGFLPTKDSDMRREIQSWTVMRASIVYFEPTRRLETSLALIAEIHPRAEVSVGRELTKLFEEIVTRPVAEMLDWVRGHTVLKGEAVVMVYLGERAEAEDASDEASAVAHIDVAARQGFAAGKSLKGLLKELGGLGLPRAELYQKLLEIKDSLNQEAESSED